MASPWIQHVSIDRLHGHYNLDVSLKPRLNVLFGRNGTGKTTFLHILANLTNRDIERFCHIRFRTIEVMASDGTRIALSSGHDEGRGIQVTVNSTNVGVVHKGEDTPPAIRELLREHVGGRPVYLPAFRSVLEALGEERYARYRHSGAEESTKEIARILSQEEQEERGTSQAGDYMRYAYRLGERTHVAAYKTLLCRDWFGQFVPIIRCPSLWEVADALVNEYQGAQLELAATDRDAFRTVFYEVLHAIVSPPHVETSESIEDLLKTLGNKLRSFESVATSELRTKILDQAGLEKPEDRPFLAGILKVYEKVIRAREDAEETAFGRIKTFQESVNGFLQDKSLAVENLSLPTGARAGSRATFVRLADGRPAPISVLSSGERQVITLLFSATHMSPADGIVLIDEPELSLHVDWQRIILRELMVQAGDRQVIACTHAPEVGADHYDEIEGLDPMQFSVPDAFDPAQGDEELVTA